MSGFSTILGGGGAAIGQVNYSIDAASSQGIPALYIANSITDTAGLLVAIHNTNLSAITLSIVGGSIVNSGSYAAISTSTSVTLQAGQTIVLETNVANLNYYIAAYSQAVNFNGGGANQLLYQTGANATGYIAAGTNNQVLTNVTGVPTWANEAPLALDLANGATGQLVYQSGVNSTSFLAIGLAGQVLSSNGTNPVWTNAASEAANLSGGVAGSVVYQSGSGVTSYTAAGSTGQMLVSNGASSPAWGAALTQVAAGAVITAGGNTSSPLVINSTNTRGGVGFAELIQFINGGGGSNPNKFLRMDSTGSLSILNSAYTQNLFNLADGGILTLGNGALFFGASQSNVNPNSGNNNGIHGNSGYIAYQDNLNNCVVGDYSVNAHDTWIQSGRNVIIAPNGANATSPNVANSLTFNSGGQFLFGTNSTNPLIGYGAPKFCAYNNSSQDGAAIIATNGNNTLNVGKVAPNANGSGCSGTFIAFVGAGSTGTASYGSVSVNGSGVAYNQTSDARMKEDVVSITNGLEKVKALNPVSFKWVNSDASSIGFIAQEAELVVPEAVTAPNDDHPSNQFYSMDYSKIVPLLSAAIKEQQVIIDALIARLDKAGL